MNQSNLKPAGQLLQRFGVKSILYGKPGTQKTPTINTAPRPLLLVTEPGLLSMRNSTVPAWEAYTPARIEEFFQWFFGSKEAAAFDTLGIDSGSQLAEIILNEEINKQKDGRKAYGELSRRCMVWFDQLFFMPQKHVVLICKQMQAEVGKTVNRDGGGFTVEMLYQSQPYFPGNDLNIKVPHRYDLIMHASWMRIAGMREEVVGLRTRTSESILARDRSGFLDEIEPPNLTNIFAKVMQ
jgi:hypothetical protein